MYYFSTFMMATAKRIKSTRGKDKIAIHGYIYTLNKSTTQVKHWVCEKRGTLKHELQPTLIYLLLNRTLPKYWIVQYWAHFSTRGQLFCS